MRRFLYLTLLCMLVGCRGECNEGESCERACPDHAWGVCTIDNMCRCQDFLDVIEEEKFKEMSRCRHPEPGELVINEVLVDGEPTEAGEFLEIANKSDASIRIDALSVFVASGRQMSRRLSTEAGCIAPKGALLFAADRNEPELRPQWSYEVTYATRRFGFSNSSDFVAEIRLFDMVVIDRIELPHHTFRRGVSLVRYPDIDGTRFVDHRIVSGGTSSSPGTCPDGAKLSSGCKSINTSCMRPQRNWLTINEVMVDAHPETREFVEIANNTDRPIDLSGLRLMAGSASTMGTKLELWGGCLLPGELVAFYSHSTDALARDRLLSELSFDAHRFRFSNSSETRLILEDMNQQTIDDFLVPRNLIDENTSVNRYPDIYGSDITRHDRHYDERSSPGLRASVVGEIR